MAKSDNNVLTHGLNGKIGDLLVFYQRKGKTIVANKPIKTWEDSEKQKEHRIRFRKAALYAKAAQHQDNYIVAAAQKGQLPYNLAVADFFHAPEIEKVDLSGYSGKINDEIIITVTDDFAVKSVNVRITNSDGTLVEESEACLSKIDYEWIFTAGKINDNLASGKVEVFAFDEPGNLSSFEQELSL
ncbi:MAG: hypothetical protein LBU91_05195 [Bacteroidales bacterium]|jgi:hypothetical protein|nr:hypothetical protein [Bacteroidales bacterium]